MFNYDLDCGLKAASEIMAFYKEGRVVDTHKMIGTSAVVSELYLEMKAVILKLMGVNCQLTQLVNKRLVGTSDLGFLSLEFNPRENGTHMKIDMVLDVHVAAELYHVLDMLPQSPKEPTPEGEYVIEIGHIYLTRSKQIRRITHRRRTDAFKDIYPEMYPSVDVPTLMSMYGDSPENNLILTGAPGTGKTCFVKRALADLAYHWKEHLECIYVKDAEILKQDSFWAEMSEAKPDCIILDDLDDELKPRIHGRNEIVNHMLSFSDGLFNLPTKIIMTSNQPNTAIDPALIRPGRCFDILQLPHLSRQQAKGLWVNKLNAPEDKFEQFFNSDIQQISQAFLMSEYQRFTSSAGNRPYLLDSTVSIRRAVQEGQLINASN